MPAHLWVASPRASEPRWGPATVLPTSSVAGVPGFLSACLVWALCQGLRCSPDSDDDPLPSRNKLVFQVVSGSVQRAKTPPQAGLKTLPQNLLAGPYSSTGSSGGLGPKGPSGAPSLGPPGPESPYSL